VAQADTSTLDAAPADGDRAHPAIGPLQVGVIVWLSSELMFFAGMFAAWFTLASANDPWPPADVDLDVGRAAVFTVVLISSSGTIHKAVSAAERGRRQEALRWLAATFLLGGAFVANQALEFAGLGFQLDSHAYGTIFWLLVGFHWLHVLAGMVLMLAVGRLVWPGSEVPLGEHLQVTGYYWHFVDVVWIGVFTTVYLAS
jgi:cytochrome c oxidase subunit 3